MPFSEEDLHDALKFCMEQLIDLIQKEEDTQKKIIAIANLANIAMEIYNTQLAEDDMENFLHEDDDIDE